jgi:hypothetical protein
MTGRLACLLFIAWALWLSAEWLMGPDWVQENIHISYSETRR